MTGRRFADVNIPAIGLAVIFGGVTLIAILVAVLG